MNRDKVLTIGIDVRDLKVAKTGQKTVTEELCRQFRTYEDDSVRFIFFDTRLPAYTGRKKMIILLEHIRYQAWKQVILPIKAWYHHCDIVFCGDYFAPYIHLGFKTVEIFYDAFFFEYPEHYNRPWRMLFHGLAIPAAKRCSYIMTITDYAKKKIQGYTGIPENKLVTIYPGPKTLPDTGSDIAVPPHLEILTRHRYILHVGVMEKRKNLPALIHAFSRLKEVYHEPIKLVLVGQGNGKVFSDDSEQVKAAIRDCGLETEVILLGYLPDEEVAIAYRHAFMYVFPSFNEGFGIPVMEAFKFGLPVLVANNSCLPEVGGDAVVTFDPFDKEDMVAKMKQVLEDEALRKGLVEKGYKRLQYFSWKKAADQLVAVFKRAHEGV